jgi:hypothetical protein
LYIADIQDWLDHNLININNQHNGSENAVVEKVEGNEKFFGTKSIYPINTLGQSGYAKWNGSGNFKNSWRKLERPF